MPSISPPEERLLRALWSRGSLSLGHAKTDAETLERLSAAGWVEQLDPGRRGGVPRFALTERGRQLVARMPSAKPTLADVARALAALQNEVEQLRAELRSMRAGVGADSGSTSGPASQRAPGAQHGEPLAAMVRKAWRAVDHAGRHAGLVPVPELRDELGRCGLRGREVDRALLALEDQYELDLKIANDPSRVARPGDGLHEPDRGLLYYVVMR
ncbi:MAG: hypothetical protein MUF54_15775 [Polyangiaceae bacterium]|nr:hypothetical protein [Polyangiaceae bacterium]